MKKLNITKCLTIIILCILMITTSYRAHAQARRPIDSQHPAWLIHIDVWNEADPQKIIDLIPDDIKPFVILNLSLSCSYDTELNIYRRPQNAILTYESWASVCQTNQMWFTCQPASGGHTHIQDDDLDTFEYFFKKYPNFLGWNYAEQFWGFNEPNDRSSSSDVSRIALFAKLVPMHHKYGGFLTISFCGNQWSHPLNPVGMMKRNSDLRQACERYPEACLWLYKYTTSGCFYNNESVSISPFISGRATNYGVRYDNCGYNGALDTFFGEGSGHTYPNAVGYGTVMEQTCINGGAVWDGPELIWTEDFKNLSNTTTSDGYKRRNWGTFDCFDNGWIDMFRKIIDGTMYIPTRQEVVERTKVAIINDISADEDGTNLKKNAYAAPDDLYDGLYKQNDVMNSRDNGQVDGNHLFLKSTGRYRAIPVLIDCYDAVSQNIPVKMNRSDYNANTTWANQQAKVNAFNNQYPSVSSGDLFVSRFKNKLITYYPYSYIRAANTASATIPLQYNTCTSLGLEYYKFGNGVIEEHSDYIDIYLNNYRMDTTTVVTDIITINGASSRPSCSYYNKSRCVGSTAAVNDYSETWSNGVYTLRVPHNGPVDIRISCSGSNSRTATDAITRTAINPNSIAKPAPYYGPLTIEAENMDFKNIKENIINQYYSNYQSTRGHSAMGFQIMGTNKEAALRNNVKLNRTGKYNISVRYMADSANGALDINVNGNSKAAILPATKTNEWKTAEVIADLNEGQNEVVYKNVGGTNVFIDNVTYSIIEEEEESGSEEPISSDVYTLSFDGVSNDRIPVGMVSTVGSQIHEYNKSYDQGPRVYADFSNTGEFTSAMYWRGWDGNVGYLTYGEQNDYKLHLIPGNYTMTFTNIAWKGTPSYTAAIVTEGGSEIVSQNYSTTINMDGNRNAAITGSAADTKSLDFEITTEGDYVIQFSAADGNELLLCALSVTRSVNNIYTMDFEGISGEQYNGGIPVGMVATVGSEVHEYNNTYGSGPRVYGDFSDAGEFTSAMYWRGWDGNVGYLTYGEQNDHKLHLTPGSYTMTFTNIAWKGTPSYTAAIVTEGGSVVASQDYSTTINMNGIRTAAITGSAADTKSLDFDITTEGDYVIRFSGGPGQLEYLLCALKIDQTGISSGEPAPSVLTVKGGKQIPLTEDMFKGWSDNDMNWNTSRLGTTVNSGDLIYGDNKVRARNYIDISTYTQIVLTGTAGKSVNVCINTNEETGAYTTLSATFDAQGKATIDISSYSSSCKLHAIKAGSDEMSVNSVVFTKGNFTSTPLSTSMYNTPSACSLNLNTQLNAGTLVYGDNLVSLNYYADLGSYLKMELTGTPGKSLRVIFNRLSSADNDFTEKTATFDSNGEATIDFAQFEYVHLNAIKTGWGSNETTVNSINLIGGNYTETNLSALNAHYDDQSNNTTSYPTHLGEKLGQGEVVYGDASVNYLLYANLTGFNKMKINGTPNKNIRVLLNREYHEGPFIEINKPFDSNGELIIDLSEYEYIHLNAIKIANIGVDDSVIVKSIVLSNDNIEFDDDVDYYLFGKDNKDQLAISALNDSKAKVIDATNLTNSAESPQDINGANPNCIFIVDDADKVTNDKNVLVDNGNNTYSSTNVELRDEYPFFSPHDATVPTSSYTRNLTTEWATAVIPFEFDVEEVDPEIYVLSSVNGDMMNFTKVESGTIPANTCIVYRNTNMGETTISGHDLGATIKGYNIQPINGLSNWYICQ
ncbi:MAG: hypothetical protein IKO36_13025, partial [Bacteroidaceae bacterium]|nr:hypothetical protein [Bacteroidaceae bacterium]